MRSFERSTNPFANLSFHDVEQIATEIASDGVACVPAGFSDDAMGQARDQAMSAVERAGGEYTARTGPDGLNGLILTELSTHPAFAQLCRSLCVLLGFTPPADCSTKQVLRCLAGGTGLDHAYYFHFDSFELTAVVPIVMPQEGKTGDLILLPNFRPRRKSYMVNMVEKFIFDRPAMQALLKRRASHSPTVRRIRLQPGNVYFFNGNRTLHANEECDPEAMRVTLIIHYAETHGDHWVRRARRKLRPA